MRKSQAEVMLLLIVLLCGLSIRLALWEYNHISGVEGKLKKVAYAG